MTVNFSLLALDQMLNNAATLRHMSGGQFSVPLVIRMTTGAGRQLAAQHAHSLEGWYAHIPGIRVARPRNGRGRPVDARDRARRARPSHHLRTRRLYSMESQLADDAGSARRPCCRSLGAGSTSRFMTYGGSLFKALGAARHLADEGIEGEVMDFGRCGRSMPTTFGEFCGKNASGGHRR